MDLSRCIDFGLAGLCLFAVILHGLVAARGVRREVNLFFACASLAAAAYMVAQGVLHEQTVLDRYLGVLKIRITAASLFMVCFLWFTSAYTGVRSLATLLTITALFLATWVLRILSPTTLVGGEILGLRQVTLPWGEPISLLSAKAGVFGLCLAALWLAALAFVIAATLSTYLKDRRGRDLLFLFGAVVILAVAIANDVFVQLFSLEWPPIGEFGFTPVIVFMSFVISGEVIQAARIKRALEASEEQYRLLIETTGTGFLVTDSEGRVLDANQEYLRLTGHGRLDEIRGRSVLEWTAGHDLEKGARALKRCAQEGSVRNLEVDHVDRRGRIIPVEVNASAVARNGSVRFLTLCRDITERKQAEAALAHHRDELRQAVDNAVAAVEKAHGKLGRYGQLLHRVIQNIPVMIVVQDDQGHVLLWNRELERKSGWSLAKAKQSDLTEIFCPAPESRCTFVELMTNPHPNHRYEFIMKPRSGSPLESSWISIRISRDRRVGIGMDLTEMRQARREREELLEQLHQSQKMEAVGQLAGGVAHDFNNLMTVIGGYSSRVLKELPERSRLHEELQQVKMASERATHLTRQLLAFSRKQILRPEVLNLDQTISELLPMLCRLLGEDVEVLQICSLRPQFVHADRHQLEQVVMNLAVNSRDAMPKGGTLRIDIGEADLGCDAAARVGVAPGRCSTMTVSDTGTGMPPEVLEHLFEPFFTTKPVGQGTGLGLATVHGIVKQSGGGIEVRSEVGKGSSFAIYLPRHEPEEAGRTKELVAPEPVERMDGANILLVEDEEGILSLMRLELEDLGYHVLTARNMTEAEAALAQNMWEVHLLITDAVLPEASGPEVYDALARRRPGLKVLYMSGHERGQVVQRGVLGPETAFLEKPFTAEELARRIKEVLGS